jgi:hypothetical protein
VKGGVKELASKNLLISSLLRNEYSSTQKNRRLEWRAAEEVTKNNSNTSDVIVHYRSIKIRDTIRSIIPPSKIVRRPRGRHSTRVLAPIPLLLLASTYTIHHLSHPPRGYRPLHSTCSELSFRGCPSHFLGVASA